MDPVIAAELEKANAIIDALPQARFIHPEHRKRWIETVLRLDPKRIAWHAKRAGGIGGSEIGALVLAKAGEFHPFTTARDIVASKLLILPPDEGTNHTERGIRAEPFIQQMFMERYADQVAPAPAEMAALSAARHSKYPWLIGSPDDVVRGVQFNNVLTIVDYKAPKPEILQKYLKEGVTIDYVAQLHHYRAIAVDRGFDIGAMMNVFFDYEGVTGKENAFNVVRFLIDYNAELEQQMFEAGEYYWNEFVLQGKLPEYSSRKRAELDGLPRNIIQESRMMTALKIAGDKCYEMMSRSREKIEAYIEDLGQVGKDKIILSGLELTGKQGYDLDALTSRFKTLGGKEEDVADKMVLDTDALVQELEAKGFDLAPFRKPAALNPEKMMAFIEEKGGDTLQFIREVFTISLPRAKTGIVANEVKTLKQSVEAQIAEITKLVPLDKLEQANGFANVRVIEPEDAAEAKAEAGVGAQDEQAEEESVMAMTPRAA